MNTAEIILKTIGCIVFFLGALGFFMLSFTAEMMANRNPTPVEIAIFLGLLGAAVGVWFV